MEALAFAYAGGVLVTGAGGCGTAADSNASGPGCRRPDLRAATVVMTGAPMVASPWRPPVVAPHARLDPTVRRSLAGASDANALPWPVHHPRRRAPARERSPRPPGRRGPAARRAPPRRASQGRTVKFPPPLRPRRRSLRCRRRLDGEPRRRHLSSTRSSPVATLAVVAFGGPAESAASSPPGRGAVHPLFVSVPTGGRVQPRPRPLPPDLPVTWAAGDAHGTVHADRGPGTRVRRCGAAFRSSVT